MNTQVYSVVGFIEGEFQFTLNFEFQKWCKLRSMLSTVFIKWFYILWIDFHAGAFVAIVHLGDFFDVVNMRKYCVSFA